MVPIVTGFKFSERYWAGWTRAKKNALIETANPEWRDLWPDLAGELSDFPSF
ncbi:hypothetical protein [Bifidobacterium vespertilionis]|uniref:hypothetical protein n=1 Tax=Bifidobacterium vespertilionis TaxID=2562524 RepID=UPI001689C948|nr:hypothetical protein [Bifidobacterium vespertilionis]MBT1179621.1 hypothetical protein [Bifidobacterium vespertilionis]